MLNIEQIRDVMEQMIKHVGWMDAHVCEPIIDGDDVLIDIQRGGPCEESWGGLAITVAEEPVSTFWGPRMKEFLMYTAWVQGYAENGPDEPSGSEPRDLIVTRELERALYSLFTVEVRVGLGMILESAETKAHLESQAKLQAATKDLPF